MILLKWINTHSSSKISSFFLLFLMIRCIKFVLAYHQNKIQELEPLQSHLRLVTEECDHKIHARWAQEQSEISAIKMDKKQLQRELESLKEREKATHAVVHFDKVQSNTHLSIHRIDGCCCQKGNEILIL